MEALAPHLAGQAAVWAERLALPQDGEAQFAMQLGEQGLQLVELGPQAPGPVRVDFVEGAVAHRRLFGGGTGQMIAKAVGVQPGVRPRVLDATAGLGRDGFVLASLGCSVTLIERQPLIAALLVALLSVFFQKTATGRALRAVADDHQAAQSIGIPLNRIWVIVWCVAGVVALVAGMIWGSKLGVQFSLATVALRALPVVILGGLTSVPGATIGGLIIGVGERLSEVYLGPYVGGGIEIWFAYVLALGFLLIRPQGLFGEKIIDRV